MSKIVRNYAYNVAYQILVLLVPIVTAPYLARTLGAEKLGIYGFVYSSGSLIAAFALLGIYSYGNRQTAYVRDNREELTRTFWELMYTRFLLGIIGTIYYVVFSWFNREYTLFFLIYYPFILAQFLDVSWVFVGLENMGPAVMKNFAAKVINVIGIFLFVRKKEDLWIYILLLAVTALITNLSVYFQLSKYIGRPCGSFRSIGKHIRGSVHLFLPEIAMLLYLQMDKVMIKWLTGATDQITYYDQAEKIIKIPLALITVMSTVMMPRIANEYKNNGKDKIQPLLIKAGKFTLFSAFPLMAGLFVVARQFVPWYLGKGFMATAYAMMILVPFILFNSLGEISGKQYFTATNQINILMKAYVSSAVVNIIVNALLIPPHGYVGAAVATVLSSFISLIIQYYDFDRQINMRPLIRYGIKYFVISLAMAIAVYFPTRRMEAKPITTLIQAFIGGAVYFLILSINKDEMIMESLTVIKGIIFGKIRQRRESIGDEGNQN